jgi:sugar phosphate isomerase/epimerase
MGFGRTISEVNLAQVFLLADRIDEAKAFALKAIELCRGIKARGVEAWGLKILADVEGGIGEPNLNAVENLYGQAIGLARRLGMQPVVGHCHQGLGGLYARVGEKERGREQYRKAIDFLRACGADGWVRKYEEEMSKLT